MGGIWWLSLGVLQAVFYCNLNVDRNLLTILRINALAQATSGSSS